MRLSGLGKGREDEEIPEATLRLGSDKAEGLMRYLVAIRLSTAAPPIHKSWDHLDGRLSVDFHGCNIA